MKFTQPPRSYLIAQTHTNLSKVSEMLEDLGADGGNWVKQLDDVTSTEVLTEVAGRLCYKSFEVGLNPNVTKVREGNKSYIGNILGQKHGSVLEHSTATFAFIGVSRVFTHEIVRHRVGTAFSQESLRFVRLDDINAWFPTILKSEEILPNLDTKISKGRVASGIAERAIETSEGAYRDLSDLFEVDKISFKMKKLFTSAFRRIAPIGLATNIVVTANHRTWRHIIEQRTSLGAEEELRLVIGDVARQLKAMFPNIYQDMNENTYNSPDDPIGLPIYEFENTKV